MGSASLIRY